MNNNPSYATPGGWPESNDDRRNQAQYHGQSGVALPPPIIPPGPQPGHGAQHPSHSFAFQSGQQGNLPYPQHVAQGAGSSGTDSGRSESWFGWLWGLIGPRQDSGGVDANSAGPHAGGSLPNAKERLNIGNTAYNGRNHSMQLQGTANPGVWPQFDQNNQITAAQNRAQSVPTINGPYGNLPTDPRLIQLQQQLEAFQLNSNPGHSTNANSSGPSMMNSTQGLPPNSGTAQGQNQSQQPNFNPNSSQPDIRNLTGQANLADTIAHLQQLNMQRINSLSSSVSPLSTSGSGPPFPLNMQPQQGQQTQQPGQQQGGGTPQRNAQQGGGQQGNVQQISGQPPPLVHFANDGQQQTGGTPQMNGQQGNGQQVNGQPPPLVHFANNGQQQGSQPAGSGIPVPTNQQHQVPGQQPGLSGHQNHGVQQPNTQPRMNGQPQFNGPIPWLGQLPLGQQQSAQQQQGQPQPQPRQQQPVQQQTGHQQHGQQPGQPQPGQQQPGQQHPGQQQPGQEQHGQQQQRPQQMALPQQGGGPQQGNPQHQSGGQPQWNGQQPPWNAQQPGTSQVNGQHPLNIPMPQIPPNPAQQRTSGANMAASQQSTQSQGPNQSTARGPVPMSVAPNANMPQPLPVPSIAQDQANAAGRAPLLNGPISQGDPRHLPGQQSILNSAQNPAAGPYNAQGQPNVPPQGNHLGGPGVMPQPQPQVPLPQAANPVPPNPYVQVEVNQQLQSPVLLPFNIPQYPAPSIPWPTRSDEVNKHALTDIARRIHNWTQCFEGDPLKEFTPQNVTIIRGCLDAFHLIEPGLVTALDTEQVSIEGMFYTSSHRRLLAEHIIALNLQNSIFMPFFVGLNIEAGKSLVSITDTLYRDPRTANLDLEWRQAVCRHLATRVSRTTPTAQIIARIMPVLQALYPIALPVEWAGLMTIIQELVDLVREMKGEKNIYASFFLTKGSHGNADYTTRSGGNNEWGPVYLCTFPGVRKRWWDEPRQGWYERMLMPAAVALNSVVTSDW